MNRKYWSYQLAKRANCLLKAVVLLLLLGACKTPPEKPIDFSGIEKLMYSGELKKAELLADSIKATNTLSETNLYKLDSMVDIGNRIRIDFVRTEEDVKKQLSTYFPVLDSSLLNKWETTQKLEMRVIDGEKRYFKNAVANLFRLDDEARKQKEIVDGFQVDSLDLFRLEHTRKVISETKVSGETVLSVRMKLTYLIDVDINAVPDGKIIRCWMPFPREGNPRQKNLKLISSEPESAKIASNKNLQRTVYMEKRAQKDQPTIFRIEFEVETSAQYFDLNPDEIKPYNTESSVYKENTCERTPQIIFTPKIKQLANQILEGETNPLKKVQKIYNWINDSVRWASALEYSIMPDIPGYVMETRHGDCGMQTLLFMTLARSQGIPVKFQRGELEWEGGNLYFNQWSWDMESLP